MASGYVGILVSDPWLQNQFTQVELRSLKSHFLSIRRELECVTLDDLPSRMSKLKIVGENLTDKERASFLLESYQTLDEEVDFELFLRVYLKMQAHANARMGGGAKNSSAFLKASTTTLLHTISESEKTSYVAHINSYLGEDEFLKRYLPIDPLTNDLFEIVKDGVLLCKLINVAVPGTIDERAINTKRKLNPWERNENHTLFLNSCKAIGCTVVNIGTQDFIEGRRHLVLGLISQIIKIQLLADLNLRNTPQLVELVEDSQDIEELMSLAPEKILLRWMNFQLKKTSYKKTVTNFSSDVKDGMAYAYLLSVLAPEHSSPNTFTVKDPLERARLILEHADQMGCKRYLTAKDIVEGSPNLNLAFVAHIFQHRNGLSSQTNQISFLDTLPDDSQVTREENAFRLWINSLGNSTYIDNVFEDVRNGWVLLEALDKVSPGIVNWKIASKPPIKMPFRKVENCNQVVKIGKQLKFSLVNIAGNDIVQGNKKLILAFLWQLMRCNILQLLKNLRFYSHEKEITDADILKWANTQVKNAGRHSHMNSFKSSPSVINYTEEFLLLSTPALLYDTTDQKVARYLNGLKEEIWQQFPYKEVENMCEDFYLKMQIVVLIFLIKGYLCCMNRKGRENDFLHPDLDKSISDGIFFLDLLSAVEPRVVNWSLVTKGVTDEEKRMNATYVISIARKLGCSIFLLPEDIIEVNQKMILTLTASIMYWFMKHPIEERPSGGAVSDSESGNSLDTISNSTIDDTASETSSTEENGNR